MNVLIKEFQKQCVIFDKGSVLDFDYDKYAKLIINECMKVCDKSLSKYMLPSDHIREHFGIGNEID